MDLRDRGWTLLPIGYPNQSSHNCEVWRFGSEPFCVELELWSNGQIHGRLCAPGLNVTGTMIFESLKSVLSAVEFLEKLLDGAIKALPKNDFLNLHERDS
jgi:hypothetical protein